MQNFIHFLNLPFHRVYAAYCVLSCLRRNTLYEPDLPYHILNSVLQKPAGKSFRFQVDWRAFQYFPAENEEIIAFLYNWLHCKAR